LWVIECNQAENITPCIEETTRACVYNNLYYNIIRYILRAKMNPTKCMRIVTNNWGQGINYLLC